VPAKYQGLYDQTAQDLGAFSAAISAMPNYAGKTQTAQFGYVELLDANGNRQAALLQPSTLSSVDQSLDAFKRLGVAGVVLGIKLPLLIPTFTPQAAQYAHFFSTVADHARARGLGVSVELSALFCGTIYSQCSYAYPTTVDGWATLTAQQARIVIDQVHPDDIDLISEPNTEANLTGIRALETVQGMVEFVTTTLNDIGPHPTTKLFAGAASWFGPTYDQAIVATPIDGLVTHIYPATATTAANLVETAQIAHAAGKPIIADEAWLYKGTTTAGGNVQASNQQGALNTYSFFEPLDVEFFRAARMWAEKAGSTILSGFWSWQTLAYLTWTPALDAMPAAQQLVLSDQAAAAAINAGTSSNTGRALVGK